MNILANNNGIIIVDLDYCIRIAGLEDYRETVSKDTWRVLKEMVRTFKQRDLKVSFFSSTPQGGGGKKLFVYLYIYKVYKYLFLLKKKDKLVLL